MDCLLARLGMVSFTSKNQREGSLNLRGCLLLLFALSFLAHCRSLSQSCSHGEFPTRTTKVLKLFETSIPAHAGNIQHKTT